MLAGSLKNNFFTVTKTILSTAWIGLIVSAYISLSFLPPRPRGVRRWKYLEMVADWIVIPIAAVFFGSIPALEAQTRMMLGKYLTFWVTPKKAARAK